MITVKFMSLAKDLNSLLVNCGPLWHQTTSGKPSVVNMELNLLITV